MSIFRGGGGTEPQSAHRAWRKSKYFRLLVATGSAVALTMTGTIVPPAMAQNTALMAPKDLPPLELPDSQNEISGVIDADAFKGPRAYDSAGNYLPGFLTDSFGRGAGLIGGHVWALSNAPNSGPEMTGGNNNVPLNNITVYAQFIDGDGSVSPVYKTKTRNIAPGNYGNGGPGTFAFGMYGDRANGTKDYNGTVPGGIKWTDKKERSTNSPPAATNSGASGSTPSIPAAAPASSCCARPMATCPTLSPTWQTKTWAISPLLEATTSSLACSSWKSGCRQGQLPQVREPRPAETGR